MGAEFSCCISKLVDDEAGDGADDVVIAEGDITCDCWIDLV